MFHNKKIMESKHTKKKLKEQLNKSISLLINSSNYSNNMNNKKIGQYMPKTSYSVQTSERKLKQGFGNIASNNAISNSKLHNFNLYRQNSQGSLYHLKKDYNEYNFFDINQRYQRLNMRLLSEVKTPKMPYYMNNNQKKIQKSYNFTQYYNDRYNENKANYNSGHNNNKLSQNSFTFVNRHKNLSQKNIKLKLEEYYDNSIIKRNKNQKNSSKLKLKDDDSESFINKKISTKLNRYDKNKCIIERKFYGEDKLNKAKEKNKLIEKNKEKEINTINKTLSGNGDEDYNKIFYHYSRLNMKRDLKKPGLDTSNNNSNNNLQNSKEKKNFGINNLMNYKFSSTKMLLNKSKTKSNILNTSLEEVNKSKPINNYVNIISSNNNKEIKNCRYNDIKLIFPSFLNKMDMYNDSSQESTNLVGNTFSNKITINNSNIVNRKDKFINSFLDGPEDIHWRFVDLHKQRKLFYENICNKSNEMEGNLYNNNMAKISDFDKNEYSEYFDNINEDVPII